MQPGQSRSKDRNRFNLDNVGRWVVVSATLSRHHPGFVECIATLGRGRAPAGTSVAREERRYLVLEDIYDIGEFAFVIDEGRDQLYTGPSSFIGWSKP
ncbi:hypothetical protein [Rhizobium tubonense]|uniref:hypothetical protein n=1 Tax=Rhizobium tubonense TaxID=484088 RepID=UPI001FCF0253|nr:hypothetical protein [Rhizobium tubonense]